MRCVHELLLTTRLLTTHNSQLGTMSRAAPRSRSRSHVKAAPQEPSAVGACSAPKQELSAESAPCCWVCLEEAAKRSDLIRPCACRAGVHRACLQRWREEGGTGTAATKCSLCKTAFVLETRAPSSWSDCASLARQLKRAAKIEAFTWLTVSIAAQLLLLVPHAVRALLDIANLLDVAVVQLGMWSIATVVAAVHEKCFPIPASLKVEAAVLVVYTAMATALARELPRSALLLIAACTGAWYTAKCVRIALVQVRDLNDV